MAGDKVIGSSSVVNREKVHQGGAYNVHLNLEDEFTESVEYIPCPEFQFSVRYYTIIIFLLFVINIHCHKEIVFLFS